MIVYEEWVFYHSNLGCNDDDCTMEEFDEVKIVLRNNVREYQCRSSSAHILPST